MIRIGYPCINNSIGCTANRTFRLRSYSKDLLISKVKENLGCLKRILEYNKKHNIPFFRIGSGLIPFASHPVCSLDWENYFKEDFQRIGEYIKKNDLRVTMHPDQFVLINALDRKIIKKSIKELEYHVGVLDVMKLDSTNKVQIHIGGVYGDKRKSMERFIDNYKKLDFKIRKRLVVENDDKSYSLRDCLEVSRETKIPVVLDLFHHELLNNGESVRKAVKLASKTWKEKDGPLMIDYSYQDKNRKKGTHAEKINLRDFKEKLKEIEKGDIMIELREKEKNALKALNIYQNF